MTATAERRRSVRYPADWPAWYQLDGRAHWRNARLIDVSKHGAAIELFDTTPSETPSSGRLQLQVASVAPDGIGVRLAAWIRRRISVDDARVLVGVEFAPLRNDEAALLHLMVGLRAMA
jgi:hypothetical protein